MFNAAQFTINGSNLNVHQWLRGKTKCDAYYKQYSSAFKKKAVCHLQPEGHFAK
jgi:hypothetical protein